MPDDDKLTRDELLVGLIEECAEVIKAATKCLRFGYDRQWPGYGRNSSVLANEMGDVLGIVDELELDRRGNMEGHRKTKIERMLIVKRMVEDADGRIG